MGNFLIKEIEDNMQLKLYNKLYKSKEMTDLLNEPESVAERRKELNDIIKVMRNAQKIIKRDPDLMVVMQININDSDITDNKKGINKIQKNIDSNKKSNLEKPQTKTQPQTNREKKNINIINKFESLDNFADNEILSNEELINAKDLEKNKNNTENKDKNNNFLEKLSNELIAKGTIKIERYIF